MASVRMSSKNQIVIPREAREALSVRPGDELLVVPKGRTVVVTVKPSDPVKALAGTGRGVYGRSDRYIKKERASWKRGRCRKSSRGTGS